MKKEIKNIISLALSLIIVNVSLGTSVQGAEISNYSMHNNNIGTAVIENSKDDKAGIQYDYEDIVWSRYKIAAKPYGNRESVFDNTTDDSVRYQDDFYGAMNNAWLKEADSYLSDDLQEISYYSYLQLKSANDINNIFKEFYTSKSRSNNNWGLGLYYTYKVVKKHMGYVSVESKVGVKTTFQIVLPRWNKKARIRKGMSRYEQD